jgi:ubiquinone/menaquinone biosynthesis C-methylase UbiE
MNYIWDNVDKYLNKTDLVNFLQLGGIDLRNANVFDKVSNRKRSYTSLNIITKDSYILDIGCGLGEDCLELSFLTGNKGKVFGVDISDALINEAQQITAHHNIPNISFKSMDAHQLEYEDSFFDFACIRRSLQHMINPKQIIDEALRVLKPGGSLIIIEPDRGGTIINHPDRQITRMIMTYVEEVVRNPWIGRQLKSFLPTNKLNLQFEIDLLINFSDINNNFGIEKATNQLVNMNLLSSEQANNWLNTLKELDSNNQLFFSTTHFIAITTK